MKIAPIYHEMARWPHEFEQIMVHTGQHYDTQMSKVFFTDLGLPLPEINLGVGSGSHAWQTAQIMLRFEPVVMRYQPDWVIVPGDVNSTLAGALVCAKLGIKIAHLEAGLRSFDRSMPEEINRLLTDQMADLLFTPSPDANENLLREGIKPEKIHFVGNAMIDTLTRLLPQAEQRWPALKEKYGLDQFILVTLHRPSNVDDLQSLSEILLALKDVSEAWTVMFPVHPRTWKRLQEIDQSIESKNIKFISPLGYIDFLALEARATVVITDSGGVQEETTYLNIPCITIRPNTERPITLDLGTNRLVDNQRWAIVSAVENCLGQPRKSNKIPELWDGKTAARVVAIFRQLLTDQ